MAEPAAAAVWLLYTTMTSMVAPLSAAFAGTALSTLGRSSVDASDVLKTLFRVNEGASGSPAPGGWSGGNEFASTSRSRCKPSPVEFT